MAGYEGSVRIPSRVQAPGPAKPLNIADKPLPGEYPAGERALETGLLWGKPATGAVGIALRGIKVPNMLITYPRGTGREVASQGNGLAGMAVIPSANAEPGSSMVEHRIYNPKIGRSSRPLAP